MKAGISHISLMCHAPIVVPEIAGDRAFQVERSTRAMEQAAQRLTEANPATVVVLSPHSPRLRSSFGVAHGKAAGGDFGLFGFREISVRVPLCNDSRNQLIDVAASAGLTISECSLEPLDHGAMVPLHFLRKAGWSGSAVLLSFPYTATSATCRALGASLEAAAKQSGKRWAILASGDMSHRLSPGAPAGYHPRAAAFDAEFCRLIGQGELQAAVQIDGGLRSVAAEDVVDSVEVAAAAINFKPRGCEVISYEGPFGVGYLVATLHDAEKENR